MEFDVTDGQKGKVATNVTAPGGLAFNRVLVSWFIVFVNKQNNIKEIKYGTSQTER